MKQLSDRVYVIPGGTNVGVVIADDGRAVLIDSGLNDTPARKILRAVTDELGTTIRAIIVTHGHSDHFGGNRFLVNRTDARVYAPDIDELSLRHPMMMPTLLFGGADPVDEIRTRFLVADASPVHGIIAPGEQELEGVALTVISLAGHSPNQMGMLVDGVFFCADVVFPEATLEKYPIPYLSSLTEHLNTLALAADVPADRVVPGHGPVLTSMRDLVALNQSRIAQVIEVMLAALDESRTADDLASRVFRAMDVPITDAQSYYLLRPTIHAYLSHLHRMGKVDMVVVDHEVRWRRQQ